MAKTIVIIGAGPGVGMAVAERFGAAGYNVALLARNEEKLNGYVAQLEKQGITAFSHTADVMDRKSLIDALDKVKDKYGAIDVVEFSPLAPMESMILPRNIDVENLQFHLDFQLLSTVAVVQHLLPDMIANKNGTFLFSSAPSATKPLCITAGSGIAAGGLLNYFRLLNKDLGAENIFAGVIFISGVVYNGEEPDEAIMKHFPKGMPFVAAKDIAEAHWNLYTGRKESEIYVGDVEAVYSVPGFY